MSDETKTDRQPNWQPEQMETDEGESAADRPRRPEVGGGLRGGGAVLGRNGSGDGLANRCSDS